MKSPGLGEEKAGALRDGRRRGAPGGMFLTVQTPLNTFREARDVIQVTFLRVPSATLSRSRRVNSSKADADDPTLIDCVELATA